MPAAASGVRRLLGPALLVPAGAGLLALSGAFARWAEDPAPPPGPLHRLLDALLPPERFLVVGLGATLAALWYLGAPSSRRERTAFVLAAGAALLSLTPAVAVVTLMPLYLALGAAGAVALAAGVEPWAGSPARALAERAVAVARRSGWRRFLASACVVHLGLTLALSHLFFGGVPHVQDSVAQLFQAKILARGVLFAPAPPVPEAFDYSHLVVADGRWFSLYHMVHPLLLAVAGALHAPAAANPLLGVAGLLGLAHLARSVAGEASARIAVLLALVSPWWLLMHAEFMNHVTAGAALTWAVFLFVKAGRGGGMRWALLSGLLFGVAFLVRPYTPLLVGAALLVFSVSRIARGERRWLLACVLIACGALPGVLVQLESNVLTTGSALLEPYVVKQGPGVVPGFHQPPWGPPHTPRLGLRNVMADLNALNRWVLGFPVPLALLAAGFVCGARARPGWLAGIPLALLAGHFAFWYVDFCFGPRYLFEALPALLILAALALQALWARSPARLALVAAIALGGAPAVWRGLAANYASAFYGVDDRVAARVAAAAPADALVFVVSDYGGFVWRNDPWLKEGPVFVRDSSARERVLAAFPGRRPFRQEGDLIVPLR